MMPITEETNEARSVKFGGGSKANEAGKIVCSECFEEKTHDEVEIKRTGEYICEDCQG